MNRNTIDELKKDPIFNMSLHSKELFHSNFWAWLMQRNKQYIRVFFEKLSDEDLERINPEEDIRREEGHRDITIWLNKDNAYVIENKLKSLPQEEQLKVYKNDLKELFRKGIITGINKPNFEAEGWDFLSYNTIASRIEEINREEKEPFEKELILRYVKMLQLINNVIKDCEDEIGDNIGQYEQYKDVREIRLDDICQKRNAERAAQHIRKKLTSEDFPNLHISTGYTRASSLVSVEYKVENDNKRIGVQIQGSQYRRFVLIRNIKPTHKFEESLFETFCKKEWFDKNNQDTIFGHETSMRPSKDSSGNRYNKYVDDNSVFLYQHFDFFKNNMSDFESLTAQISKDMDFAKKLLGDLYRLDREAAGWTEETGYPEGYVHQKDR